MQLFPEQADPSTVYSTMIRAITPRPIAWVSTQSADGIHNLAPFSYFNGVGTQPAALMFSPVNRPDGSKKDTVLNIEAIGQFVVNMVSFANSESMFQTAGDFDAEVSEFEEVGLTPQASTLVSPPRVAESKIHFECELLQIVEIGSGPLAANVIFGKILLMDIADELLDARGKIDPGLSDSVGRMGGMGYCRTTERFELKPPV